MMVIPFPFPLPLYFPLTDPGSATTILPPALANSSDVPSIGIGDGSELILAATRNTTTSMPTTPTTPATPTTTEQPLIPASALKATSGMGLGVLVALLIAFFTALWVY